LIARQARSWLHDFAEFTIAIRWSPGRAWKRLLLVHREHEIGGLDERGA
jgi:hypothetical protein